jgi:acetyltransferase
MNEAEFGILIIDRFQHRGLGTEMLNRLIQIGRDEKLDRLAADILHENIEMQKICAKIGFRLTHEISESVIKAVLDL